MTSTRRLTIPSALIAAVCLPLLLAACHDDEVCNPGLRPQGSICVPVTASGGSGGTSGGSGGTSGGGGTAGTGGGAGEDAATSPDAPASEGGAGDGSSDNFGASCADMAGCASGPATYCAIQPGQSMGFCTKTGCDVTPANCPAGWGCYIIPNVIGVCTPPSPDGGAGD